MKLLVDIFIKSCSLKIGEDFVKSLLLKVKSFMIE